VAWSFSCCSRNAHDQNVLVRRAQLRIDQATPLERKRRTRRREGSSQTVDLGSGIHSIRKCWLDRRSGANRSAISGERQTSLEKFMRWMRGRTCL